MEQATNTILLMGRPGSGKGTQAGMLAGKFAWEHFSTGNQFKELREGAGVLSVRVKEAYDSGKIFPDWFANYLFEHAFLNLDAAKGIVCEGYPRTLAQAVVFDETLEWLGRPYKVFNLEVSDEETIRRQIERAKTEHRPDSATEEQIQVRLEQYQALTEPVLEYFKSKGTLIQIDGMGTMDAIHADILSHL